MDMKNSVVNDHAVFFLGGLVALVRLVELVGLVLLDYFTSAPLALYVSPLRMMRS